LKSLKVERERKTKRKREITQRRADRGLGQAAGSTEIRTQRPREGKRGIPQPRRSVRPRKTSTSRNSVRNDGGFHGLPRWGAALSQLRVNNGAPRTWPGVKAGAERRGRKLKTRKNCAGPGARGELRFGVGAESCKSGRRGRPALQDKRGSQDAEQRCVPTAKEKGGPYATRMKGYS